MCGARGDGGFNGGRSEPVDGAEGGRAIRGRSIAVHVLLAVTIPASGIGFQSQPISSTVAPWPGLIIVLANSLRLLFSVACSAPSCDATAAVRHAVQAR